MKKLILITLLCSASFGVLANTECEKLGEISDNNYQELDALEVMEVSIQKGSRVYFHNAPSKSCVIKQKFVIPNDQVIAYYSIKNEGLEWIYVVYTGKNNIKTTGWVKKKYFKFIKTIAMDG
ncbi:MULTISPECIES: hypothetical protein [unclassified Acinetobacter]|uniref:hypothetical protein n=1 Tax=unclassified Acinetobacter TaxID=196816 RepID=UPI00190AB940|nr:MULTISPECIES: hypothetical protein [unclassified Acinetobacter]MBK0062147.1 hypothetical protein [Acinetobacter sp. S55]MBK0065951.1 hypothetical protein [Acinetobacter sp. S54]